MGNSCVSLLDDFIFDKKKLEIFLSNKYEVCEYAILIYKYYKYLKINNNISVDDDDYEDDDIISLKDTYYKYLEINNDNNDTNIIEIEKNDIEKKLLTKMINNKFKKYIIDDDKEDIIIKQTSELLLNNNYLTTINLILVKNQQSIIIRIKKNLENKININRIIVYNCDYNSFTFNYSKTNLINYINNIYDRFITSETIDIEIIYYL
jgi:hypothetical protein